MNVFLGSTPPQVEQILPLGMTFGTLEKRHLRNVPETERLAALGDWVCFMLAERS